MRHLTHPARRYGFRCATQRRHIGQVVKFLPRQETFLFSLGQEQGSIDASQQVDAKERVVRCGIGSIAVPGLEAFGGGRGLPTLVAPDFDAPKLVIDKVRDRSVTCPFL